MDTTLDTQSNMQDILQERYRVLPQDIHDLLEGAAFTSAIQTLTQKLELDEETATSVENEIVLALMGFEPFGDLDTNFMEQAGLDEETAQALLVAVLEKLDELSPSDTPLPTVQEGEEESAPEEPRESPILQATRTMQQDIAEAQNDDTPRWRTVEGDAEEEEGPTEAAGVDQNEEEDLIPRYSKPLTDTPKYE